VGPAQDGLVAPDLLIRRPDPGWCGLTDPVRSRRARDRLGCRAFGPDEVDVVVDEPCVAGRIELADQQRSRIIAVLAERRDERLDRALLVDGLVRAIGVDAVELDVEVADGPESSGGIAKAVAVGLGPPLPERLTEYAPGGALAASRDPHLVDVLDVIAVPDARLALEHPGEVEAHHLAAGLGDRVLGKDTRGLADDEARLGLRFGRVALLVRVIGIFVIGVFVIRAIDHRRDPRRLRPARPRRRRRTVTRTAAVGRAIQC